MDKYLAVEASAGSGKTYALTLRYVSLLFLDIDPKSILTLTFTNKAALEMSMRIFETLQNLGDSSFIVEEIASQTKISKEDLLQKKELVVTRFLQSELAIFTIDAFIGKILREFCGYVELNDEYAIDADDKELLLYRFLKSLDHVSFELLLRFSYKYEKKLSSIVGLFEQLYFMKNQYRITDFSDEILELLGKDILKSALILREYLENFPLSDAGKKALSFTNIETLFDLGKTWLTKESLFDYTYFKKAPKDSEIDLLFEKLKSQISDHFKYQEIAILNQLFTIYQKFSEFRFQYKKETGLLTFDDITLLVGELLEQNIQKDFLYFRLDARYDHILIDEFQDTSVAQYTILEPLIEELFSSAQEFRTFFYVGDVKQSIYRFRGGKKELFWHLYNKFDFAMKKKVLEINYRSATNIVSFVNDIFHTQSDYPYAIQYSKSESDGFVEVRGFDSEQDEQFETIATALEELFASGATPKEIAILTFTNDEVVSVYRYLKERFPELPISTDMTSKLIAQKNIQAVIALIRYIIFKEDIYRLEANILLGFSHEHYYDETYDIKNTPLSEVVYRIGREYEIIDHNFLLFMEQLGAYKDCVSFAFEIDKLEKSVQNRESTGVQILTVFKSKGLEFDHVILLDRTKGSKNNSSGLLFLYDSIYLERIFFKSKSREAFDSEYKYALQEEELQSRIDTLNIIYVALTRAKSNLIVLKKNKGSIFDVLEYPITNHRRGIIQVESKTKNLKEQDDSVEIVYYEPLTLGKQKLDTRGSSNLIEDDFLARQFGLATHYCLEMMEYFTLDSLSHALPFVYQKFGAILNQDQMESLKKRITMLLGNPLFIKLTQNKQIQKEVAIAHSGNIKIIDLLVLEDECCLVFDYKTTSQKHRSHAIQVTDYKNSITQVMKKRTYGYLVYLFETHIELEEIV